MDDERMANYFQVGLMCTFFFVIGVWGGGGGVLLE